jgi:hypothetical protein
MDRMFSSPSMERWCYCFGEVVTKEQGRVEQSMASWWRGKVRKKRRGRDGDARCLSTARATKAGGSRWMEFMVTVLRRA